MMTALRLMQESVLSLLLFKLAPFHSPGSLKYIAVDVLQWGLS